MVKVLQRLQFENVFPDEKPKEILDYLKNVSRESLLMSIGFCSKNPDTNFDNFFSNPDLHNQVIQRVMDYSKANNIVQKPRVISKYAGLKLAEHILSNKEILNNKRISVDEDEMNLFKAFLIINTQLNAHQKLNNLNDDNFEKLVDFNLVLKFPESDLALFEEDGIEFLKLVFCTIHKVEELFKFLNSNLDFEEIKNEFLNSFSVGSEQEFIVQMKYLFGQLLMSIISKGYAFEVQDEATLKFLLSMTSDNIMLDEDFTHLKNNPIYFLGENRFSVVNYFFVVDKFYRSTKFKLKEIYESKDVIKKKYGNFFGFFNKEFSENFLMKNVLDDIFDKEDFYKKRVADREIDRETDYYIRHGNTVFLFENKDVLISKAVKSSANIDEINAVLHEKFVHDGKKAVGIGQLVNSIEEIVNKSFQLDEYVNSENDLSIFPVLIIQDRIFQSPGINYRLNSWYLNIVRDKLKDKYDPNIIKGLTIIDIDTLIVWTPYLKEINNRFEEIITDHLFRMQSHKEINASTFEEARDQTNNNLYEQISPISTRNIPFQISVDSLAQKFKEIIVN
ncbi:hypothetical protein [Flavobacterium sp. FlaQc-47]|uniref:hypothetical protein n=1 Tax=Flavobacterium sp. FlaQc-47 TaxID=3374180 RepID=UPI003756D383